MGDTLKRMAGKLGASMLALCLALSLVPAYAHAAGEPYGTHVGEMAQTTASGDHVRTGTDVNIAVKGNLTLETSPALTIFDYPEQLEGDECFLVSTARGGVKIKDAPDGLPYAYSWSRQVYDAATKTFVDELPTDPYKMTGTVEVQPTDDGMTMRYDLVSDAYRMNTLYRYRVSITDAAGNTCENTVEVFCGNEYIYGTITNGKPGKRDAVQTAADLAAEADANTDTDTTIVDVTAMRLFDSELVVAELGAEMRSMLLSYAQGNVMDSATNVSLVSERATEDKPVFITPPMVKLAFRLHDQTIEEGWPVRVLAIQDGRVVTVSEEDAVVETDADGYKIARVGILDDEDSGVDALGVFAVTYPPRGGAADQVKVTSGARMPVGLDGFGEAIAAGGRVAPADTDTLYAVGTRVRYTFLPDEGYAFDFVTLGANPDGAKNPRVVSTTDNTTLGANFLDLSVYKPDTTDHLYVTAYFKHVGTPSVPGTDPTDPDPVDPMLTHQIQAVAGPGGSISPAGTFQIRTGASETFTILPDDGFDVDAVTVNGHPVAIETHEGGFSTLTLKNITSNMLVFVTFKSVPGHTVTQDPLRVSVSSSGSGSAQPEGEISVARGEGLTITLLPDGASRLLSLTRDGRDITSEVAANLTYTLEAVQADTRIHATFSDAAGNVDPVVPGASLITTKTETVRVQNMYGDAVGGFVVPSRVETSFGATERLVIKPANGSYIVSATKVVRAADGSLTETPLEVHPFKVVGAGESVTGGIRMPYSYVDVVADAQEVEVRVVFDGSEYDPDNPGGCIDPNDPNPPAPGDPDAPPRYVYEEEPAPLQHRVDIEVVAPEGVPGGLVSAARNGQQIGAVDSYVMMDHGGTLSLSAFPYGGYAAQIAVVRGEDNLQAGSGVQATVPQVGDRNHALGEAVSASYTVTGPGTIRVTFTFVGGYTPPEVDEGTSLYHAVSVGAGTVTPDFASVVEGAPAATFTITPDEGYRVSAVTLYDETTGRDVSDKLGAWSASGGTIELGYLGQGAYVLSVVFGKATEGPDGPKPPVDPIDPSNPDKPYDPDKPVAPSDREYTLTARVGHDMTQYDGDGTVAIVGSSATDQAGNPIMKVKAAQKAVVTFAPETNSILAYVTIATPGSEPREVSVVGSTLVLTSFTADTTVTAYFKYGTFIQPVELSVDFSQNLSPEECGWELTGAPADKVAYGDSLTAMVSRVAGSDKADDYKLTSLTVNGEEKIGEMVGAAQGRSADALAFYTLENVVRDTQVRAVFAYDPLGVDPGPGPDEPDDPNNPDNPDDPDDPNDPNNPGNPTGPWDVSGTVTVTASTSGRGTISPEGRVTVRAGTPFTFTLKPNAGYQPVSITLTDSHGTRTQRQTTTQLSLTVTEDTTVVANFAVQAYPGANDTVSRTIRHLQSLAKTGDIQMVGALALVALACGAGGIALVAVARRRKKDEETA